MMSSASGFRTIGATLAFGVGLLFAAPAAVAAGQNECQQACADQWGVDKQACQDTLDATLAQIATDEANCIAGATTPLAQGFCVRTANIKRFAARRAYQNCVSRANTKAFNCYRSCQQSDSRPAVPKKDR